MSGESGRRTPAITRLLGRLRRMSCEVSGEGAACTSISRDLVINYLLVSLTNVRTTATDRCRCRHLVRLTSCNLPLASPLDEREQVAIDQVRVRGGEAMR